MNPIKKISITDAAMISEIHKQCFTENWNENSFRNMLSDDHYFGFTVADFEKIERGFVLCKHIFNEIEIITFCILPKCRGQGLGKRLINEVKKYAYTLLPSAKIFLEVSKDNIAAINLYHYAGFKKITERKKYYNSPHGLVDAVVMMLEIRNIATNNKLLNLISFTNIYLFIL